MIDACVLRDWPSVSALAPHLESGWRELLLESVASFSSKPLLPELADGDVAFAPTSDVDAYIATVSRWLDTAEAERAVLAYDAGLLTVSHQNHFISHALAEAANRWTEEQWLPADTRFGGLVLAPGHVPEQAAAEIRRSGQHPGMVGVLLGNAAAGAPFGHPIYHPVLEAAAELDLPLVILAGAEATDHSVTAAVSGGLPSTTSEYRALAWQTQAAHVSSLIMEGVFDLYPNLKVVLGGAGALWLPGYLWRVDYRYTITRGDARWLHSRPLDYWHHFWVTTQRLETAPSAEQLSRALGVIPEVETRLVYASGTPRPDATSPEIVTAQLPVNWHQPILHDNALALFRWQDRTARPPQAFAAATG